MKRLAILVVGHRHWGKSKTLQPLTDGKRRVEIDGETFFVRIMSNDDEPQRYLKAIENLDGQPLIILAFCPTFQDGGDAPAVVEALRRKGYEIAFFILKDRFVPRKRSSANEISAEEIDAMKAEGSVKVLRTKFEAEERAVELKTFITSRIRAHHSEKG